MDMRARILATIEAKPGLSIRRVSLAAGLSDSMLNKFLSGQTDSMTIKNAERLAKALDVDPRWLIFGEGEPERYSEIDTLFRQMPQEKQDMIREIVEAFARTGTDG